MKSRLSVLLVFAFFGASLSWFNPDARAEVILQLFETEWEEIYRRLPEIAEIGYSGIWHPSPAKSPVSGGPFAGGGNVGYSLFDRFDIGDIPQRGDRATRYGTRGHLRKMVDNAQQSNVKIYPDIVMNHAGNGPHFWTYPGMRPNDFHGWWNSNEPGGFRRSERMNAWGDIGNGWGLTFQQELVSLIDIVTEPDQRFHYNPPHFARSDSFVRQPGRYDLYPYQNPGDELPAEYPWEFLNRWIAWLGDAMNFDGARFDAPKHVVADFFGRAGEVGTFNHELQYNYKSRHGFSNYDNVDEMYQNDLRRRDTALIFSEFFIGSQGEIDYWRNYGNEFRYIDFPRKSQMIWPAFNDGNLAALSSFAGFSPEEGVMFIESHDETPPWRRDLGYAYILTRVGVPVVYSTGNNLADGESKVNTWMLPGHPHALGDGENRIPNLVYINNNFARGREWERWSEGDFYAFERYEDMNGNQQPDQGEGLLLVALSTAGGDNGRMVQTAFNPGTVLKDYTGHAGDITVNGSGQVYVEVPGGSPGYVVYAPYVVEGDGEPLRFREDGEPVDVIDWVVPGGHLASDKPRTVPRITQDTAYIDVHFDTSGPAVDSVMIKWGDGDIAPNTDTTTFFYDSGRHIVSGGFQNATEIEPGHWRLEADVSQFPEGLHAVQARVFNARDPGLPALFQTFTKVVYVDRHGPDLDIVNIDEGDTVRGNPMVEVVNTDRLAAVVEYSLNGTDWFDADQVMPGLWQFAMPSVASGAQTLHVRAGEYDWDEPRTRINETTITRTITVVDPSISLDIDFAYHARHDAPAYEIHMPFFSVLVETDSAVAPEDVTLFWNEYEMVGLTGGDGTISTVFDGRFMLGSEEGRLWGSFVNGPHIFEAHVTHGGETYVTSRRVIFNLYGDNLIDSDGDGLPDNVEMEFFDTGTNPGYGQHWPGDPNHDMIPNDGEWWTRLNPMNHDTTYNGTWDGDEDWSGDGYSNLYKVQVGYWVHSNAYHYSIYENHTGDTDLADGHDFGAGAPITPATVTVDPENPDNSGGGVEVTITYTPNEGALQGADPIYIHLGFNNWSYDVESRLMTEDVGVWTYTFTMPDEAYRVNFVFRNADGTVWDNNNNQDWLTAVTPLGGAEPFVLDGVLESPHYLIASNGMNIWAAVRGFELYVATWAARGDSDHFLYVTDEFSDPQNQPWDRAGVVYFDHTTKPYLAADPAGYDGAGYHIFANSGASGDSAMGSSGQVLEGTLNLIEVFGEVPEMLFMAVGAYGNGPGGTITSDEARVPPHWFDINDFETTDFVPVPLRSIRDNNGDGYFDVGRPELVSVVGENERDANYDIRRFFINELAREERELTFRFRPNVNDPSAVHSVELFSNVNRRDFVVLEEPRDIVTTESRNTYYRAYPMDGPDGDGWYEITVPINRTGAYRAQVRYKVDGVNNDQYIYYTDHGLRRDLAIVVSPTKALEMTMYELNPMFAEAIDDTFAGRGTFAHMVSNDFTGRPNRIDPQYFNDLGVNMLWLQPIHPIGFERRDVDPDTGIEYDPGSPYAVRNYWEVNPVLSINNTTHDAMVEFTNFVHQMSVNGVGVMLDGTFNHSAWDAVVGQPAVDMFPWAIQPDDKIRDRRIQWFARKDSYDQPATFYIDNENNDIAVAPDRYDFGKWEDVAHFYFGRYDALVTDPGAAVQRNYLHERDHFYGHDEISREVWEYFAYYPIYWLEKTGHPIGTPKEESWRGIDGLRCDFAQGLPSEFWEYAINKTRSVKWDFIFMAESLDGNQVLAGNPRHGLTYRSARHFDVLNENIVFFWRQTYFAKYMGGGDVGGTPDASTGAVFEQLDNRRNAYDLAPILLNLTGHDEIYPHNSQWRLLYAYALLSAIDGVPMIKYGQEAGAQNSAEHYRDVDPINNFAHYEFNFGKWIPNFKRYNHMTNIWTAAGWKEPLLAAYERVNHARLGSPALQSQQNYFLPLIGEGDPGIFAVAKFQEPGVSAAEQDVVFAFVNHDIDISTNRWGTFDLSATTDSGQNWFGIQPENNYQIVDLMAPVPTAYVWPESRTGSTLINNGITIELTGNAFAGEQAQYLRLIDLTAGMDGSSVNDYLDWDSDGDGIPDTWAADVGMPPGDADAVAPNGLTYRQNFLAGTHPTDMDALRTVIDMSGPGAQIQWQSVDGVNYAVERATDLILGDWQEFRRWTAFGPQETVTDSNVPTDQQYYRIRVIQ